MRKYEIRSEVTVYELQELTEEDRELVLAAMDATQRSYSPYSHFCVGAALRLEDGTMLTGSNQENAAYSMVLCAERTAIFHAQHEYPTQHIATVAVAARTRRGFIQAPIPPCGACRQVMIEVEDRYKKPMRVLLYGTDGIHVLENAKALLPFQFIGDSMK